MINVKHTIRISGFLVCIFLGCFAIYYFFFGNQDREIVYLPYFGNPRSSSNLPNNRHRVPDFSFVNQQAEIITRDSLKGEIYVTDFFFTTCTGICPVMTDALQSLNRAYSNNPRIRILSHTVMPETDSVTVLRDYADKYHARAGKWDFVTGAKPSLYRMAREGYFLTEQKGDGGVDDFVHTQMFALVDREGYIRGYYDGTDEAEVKRMIKEVRQLDRQIEYTREFVPVPIINTAINKLRMHGCLKL